MTPVGLMSKRLWLNFLFAGLFLLGTQLSACTRAVKPSTALASLDQMPAEIQSAPIVVREAYHFAVANPEVLQNIPCYCGCGSVGHTSNYACYVRGVSAEGKVLLDHHALGCSICVDITQDVMRMLEQGEELTTIRKTIDQTYSKYGPSNMP